MTALFVLALFMLAEAGDFQAGWEASERGDFEAALREWRPLAEQGDPEAQHALGVMYADGRGVPQNDAEAAKWFRKAAEQGFPEAQHNLGVMYVNGRGVPPNEVQAYAWFSIAAAQGLIQAAEVRDIAAQQMTYDARNHAQRLAQQYWEKYVLPFQN